MVEQTLRVAQSRKPWLRPMGRTDTTRGVLVCFPYAGKGPSLFHRWSRALDDIVDVHALALPGREERVAEAPVTDIAQVLADLLPELRPLLGRRMVFFGHSMGALIAAELAVALARDFGVQPAALVLSGSRPWWLQDATIAELRGLPDAELVDELAAWGGIPEEIRRQPDLVELALPAIRADAELVASLRARPAPAGPLVDCPLVLCSGRDDPRAGEADMAQWQRISSGACVRHTFDGDHFFLNSAFEKTLAAVRAAVTGRPGT
jgi:medium-chain acyl-[acyl-carrier-protein] hydrolase